MMVLIARGLYLRCEKVHSISVLENAEYDDYEGSYPKKSIKTLFNINIIYDSVQDPNGKNHNNQQNHVTINTYSRKFASELVKDLIGQVREQDPDNKKMDELIEKHFCEVQDDPSPKQVRSSRKKKRRN